MPGGRHSAGILLLTAFCCAIASMLTGNGAPALIGCILFAFGVSGSTRDGRGKN